MKCIQYPTLTTKVKSLIKFRTIHICITIYNRTFGITHRILESPAFFATMFFVENSTSIMKVLTLYQGIYDQSQRTSAKSNSTLFLYVIVNIVRKYYVLTDNKTRCKNERKIITVVVFRVSFPKIAISYLFSCYAVSRPFRLSTGLKCRRYD